MQNSVNPVAQSLNTVGILFHPKIAAAHVLAQELAAFLPSQNVSAWVSSAWEVEQVRDQIERTDLLVSIGGDGTILRVARAVIPWSVPVVGINLGKLGFLTELGASEARELLPSYLKGEGWIDERAMLEGELTNKDKFHALNDIVITRGATPRVIYIETFIDGSLLNTYKADGVILSTATGSTGYSLAVGGPILYPQAKEMVLEAIAPHPALHNALVLPPTVVVDVKVGTGHQAVLSVDGQVNIDLQDGDMVRVRISPHVTKFLRKRPPEFFYSTLMQRLGQK